MKTMVRLGTGEQKVCEGFWEAMEFFEGYNVPIKVQLEPIESSVARVREYLGQQNNHAAFDVVESADG